MSGNPRVWCNFTVKSNNGDVKLRIQDMPSDKLEEVVDLYCKYFAMEETLHKTAGVAKNTEALLESKGLITKMVGGTHHAVVICCKNDGDTEEVVGVSVMAVERKDDPDMPKKRVTKTKEMASMFELIIGIFSKYDAVKELNLDSIYGGRCVVVHPDYRGLGIAQKLLNNRRVICTAEGVPITGAWMTSFGSQKAAERDGWETAFEVPYEDLSKQFEVTFEGVPSTCKFMIAKPI